MEERIIGEMTRLQFVLWILVTYCVAVFEEPKSCAWHFFLELSSQFYLKLVVCVIAVKSLILDVLEVVVVISL